MLAARLFSGGNEAANTSGLQQVFSGLLKLCCALTRTVHTVFQVSSYREPSPEWEIFCNQE
jgi:hypothetical protein